MSDETTPHEPAPDAGHEAPDAPASGTPEPGGPAPAAEPTQPAISSGGPAPAELGWGAQPAGALPPGAATATMDPPPAPPTEPVAAAPAEPPSERRWSTRQGVLVALLVLLLGLGGGFAIGRATDSGGGDESFSNASTRDLLQQLERNGGLQQALRDLFGRLGNGNGRNLFPFNGNNNGNGNNGNNGNGNGNNGNGNTTPTPTTGSAFLGVQIGATSNGQGVEVTAVQSGSPAADAGLKQGDVITAIDGTSVNSAAALSSAIRSHQPGDSVRITYTRGGTSADAQVRLGNRASATTTPTAPPA
jgi:membrane-associated protease RseP (regulator of RpoE activity)